MGDKKAAQRQAEKQSREEEREKQVAAAAAKRSKGGKKGKGLLQGYGNIIAIVCAVGVTVLGVFLAIAGDPKAKRKGNSRLATEVNDYSFINEVNAGEKFTAAAQPFFHRWTLADVKWGMDGVKLSNMVGMPGAVQYCDKDDDMESGALPPSFDFRKEWSACTTDVYDVGNCTASYAVAAAESLAARFCLADSDRYANLRLSPQQILSCDKKSNGCKGGGVDFVWAYLQKRGLYPEACVPYVGQKGAECTKKMTTCEESAKLKPISHCVLSGEKKIKREILQNGPVVAPLTLMDDFLIYSAGVYNSVESAQPLFGADGKAINHAVTVFGWGKSEGQSYWLVKNSWGDRWGESGFARIAVKSILNDGYALVGSPQTEEAVAKAAKEKEEAELRKEKAKQERAEREERIKEKKKQREEEAKAQAAAQAEDLDDDLSFDDEAGEESEQEVEV